MGSTSNKSRPTTAILRPLLSYKTIPTGGVKHVSIYQENEANSHLVSNTAARIASRPSSLAPKVALEETYTLFGSCCLPENRHEMDLKTFR
jgi:hypothetical protein